MGGGVPEARMLVRPEEPPAPARGDPEPWEEPGAGERDGNEEAISCGAEVCIARGRFRHVLVTVGERAFCRAAGRARRRGEADRE
jgi:hypothetical protein